MVDEDHEWIKLNTPQNKENSCGCWMCQEMCKTMPCMGTPGDILRIIDHGFKDDLVLSFWAVKLEPGQDPIPMVQAKRLENKRCVFLTDDNKCKLHALGIKPIEGKLAAHNVSGIRLSYVTARTWLFKRNEDTIKKVLEKMQLIDPF
jgi:hypothetical protein